MDLLATVQQVFLVLIPMILSLSVHEYAHALAAKRLGDSTAEGMGRLTLNPIAHIDPIGTLLLPILLVFSGASSSFFFGWAKPVPVNPTRFVRSVTMRTGMLIVAAAGPLSNLLLAFLVAGSYSLVLHLGVNPSEPIQIFMAKMLGINVALCIFNMIPVYPLDGQKVLAGLLTGQTAISFERFNYRYGSYLLLGVILFARDLISIPFMLVYKGILFLVGL